MTGTVAIRPVPLTRERFLLYGDVIDSSTAQDGTMNDARFDRFDDLCAVDVGAANVSVSIAMSRTPTVLPYRIDMLERHPLGSQAFIPLSPCRLIVVVAPPGEAPDLSQLAAFETNGQQGVNYKPGTWHMPLIAFEPGQRYLIVERASGEPNCDEFVLDEPLLLEDPQS